MSPNRQDEGQENNGAGLARLFQFRSQRDVVFAHTPQGDLTASLYFPYDWDAGDKRPGILFFFGGGYQGGTRHQFVRQAMYLASRGMVVATADYRVASIHGTRTTACFEDAFTALSWFAGAAEELGMDEARIAAGGGSAGGALALGTAVHRGFGFRGIRPAALVLYNPAIGYRRIAAGEYAGRADFDLQGLGLDAETVSQIAMEDRITADLPPTYAWFGSDDKWLTSATDVFRAAQSLGCSVNVDIAQGGTHGEFNFPHRFFGTSLQAVDRFLSSIGFLDD